MKKTLLASLVGAIIVFAYQAAAWMFLPIHNGDMKFTPHEDSISAAVSTYLKEDGVYSVPGCPPGATMEDNEKRMMAMQGKPGMLIHYDASMDMDMTTPMITGFILNFISVWIIVMVINATRNMYGSFSNRFWITMAFGLFAIFNIHLGQWNWMNTPFHFIRGGIIDSVLSWALCGLWLGKYLKPPVAAQ